MPVLALPYPSTHRLTSFLGVSALVISTLLHLSFLFVHFVFPEHHKASADTIEMILVNDNNNAYNPDARVLANAALEGGGESDKGRKTSPLAREDLARDGDSLQAQEARIQEKEQELAQTLLAAQEGMKEFDVSQLSPEQRLQWEESFSSIARRQAEIEKNIRDYNARPRKYFDGPSTNSHEAALYVQQWRDKVERWGNAHYPEQAKGKIYGDVTLTVELNKEGGVVKIEMVHSSGHHVLDEAAINSVRHSGPFSSFNQAMREKMDILVITRTWTYASDGLETKFEKVQ